MLIKWKIWERYITDTGSETITVYENGQYKEIPMPKRHY